MKNQNQKFIERFKLSRFIKKTIQTFFFSAATGILTTLPTYAAENIYITYKSFQFSLKVNSLEKYAQTGEVNSNLGFYLQFVGEEEQKQFRNALTEKANIDGVLLSRLLNTAIGEDILNRLGTIISIPWGVSGRYAIRGSLVTAALNDNLTLLEFLKQFPTDLQINLNQSVRIAEAVESVINASNKMIEEMAILTEKEAKKEPIYNFSRLPDLTRRGEKGFAKETIKVTDSQRKRTFRLLIYKPVKWKEGKTPVIIMSHGLASNPEDFYDIAEQLASYGYFVALPQHRGSDTIQATNLLQGSSRKVFEINEFIDRPKDISFVLDYLEKENEKVYQGRLNLEEVGIFGHSFGGYTALAVAGATIDFDYLEKECDISRPRLNTSLLLQCRALDLPRQEYDFRDDRIKAVIASNPVNSSVFGPEGLNKVSLPVLMLAGSYDPATPAVYEQFRSFPWLNSEDKYLGLVEGQAHIDFATLDPGIQESINSLNVLTLPTPQVVRKYSNSLLVPFFNVYIEENDDFRPYLDAIASYSQYLSEKEEFKVFVVTNKSSSTIETTLSQLGISR